MQIISSCVYVPLKGPFLFLLFYIFVVNFGDGNWWQAEA